jgi:hypothetical protein
MALSLDDQLLRSAKLCGMKPDERPIYRLQLFLVANRELSSKNHQNDFQRAIETAVDNRGFFSNYEGRGTGEYLLTHRGYTEASARFGEVSPLYTPKRKNDFICTLRGHVAGTKIEIRTVTGRSSVFFNGERVRSAREACSRLESMTHVRLPTGGESAVRVIQDFAIDHGFEIVFS